MANKKKQQLRFYDGLVQLAALAKEHIANTLRDRENHEHIFSTGKDEEAYEKDNVPVCAVTTTIGDINAYIIKIVLEDGEQLLVWFAEIDAPGIQEQRDIEALGYADILILADAL